MTNFGEWLGKSNGQTMIAECMKENITEEQARAVVTTYCIIFDVEVDTREWDELMRYIWNCFNSWFGDFDEMDNYMCKLLV